MTDTPEKLENITFGIGAEPVGDGPVGIPLGLQRLCGDIGMRIDRNGVWHYQGSAIRRPALVRLFSTVLQRDSNGSYWLITPAEVAPVGVEDAPFLAVTMVARHDNGVNTLWFETNVGRETPLDPMHPLRIDIDPETQEPRPYIRISSDGTEARLTRNVFYALAERAKETDISGSTILMVESAGTAFALGDVTEET